MVKYIKCPRCELNYIDSEKQEYCDVCIAELKGKKLQFADLEDEYEEIDAELENEELCPVCGVNRILAGEKMCESCKAQQEYEDEDDVDMETDEEWKNYLEEDAGDLTVDEELQEEIEEEFAGDGDDEYDNESDDEYFESEEVDPLAELEDDFDDEDFDDEDDDDEDDDF